jgi:hypothetical protein
MLATKEESRMKIAKPLLLVITPLGVGGALYEAYRQGGGGLVILLVALIGMMCFAVGGVVLTIRKEQRARHE